MKYRNKMAGLLAAALALPLLAAAQGSSESAAGSTGTELADVITAYAKRNGKKVIIDPRVRQVVTVAGLDANRLNYEQLLAVLAVHQFAAYEDGDLLIVGPDANARQFPTSVFTDAKFKAENDEIVTLLQTPKNACAVQLVPILRPMMPQAAHLAATPQANSLVIVDRAVNVRRIADIMDKIDRATPAGRSCEDSWVVKKDDAPKK